MSSFPFRALFASALLACTLLPPAAHCGPLAGTSDSDDRTVNSRMTAHVDFSNPSQVDRVYRQLKTQARYVCDQAATYDKDYDTRAERACEADALAGAVRDVNQPQLSRLDAEKTGHAQTELSLNSPVH